MTDSEASSIGDKGENEDKKSADANELQKDIPQEMTQGRPRRAAAVRADLRRREIIDVFTGQWGECKI